MSNDENANVASSTAENTNMTIDAFGNMVPAESTPASSSSSSEIKKPVDKKIFMIIGGVVAALAVLIIILNAGGGGGARGVAIKYAKAYKNYDAAALVKLFPKDMLDAYEDGEEDMEKELQEIFDAAKEEGTKIIDYDVDEGEEVSKEDLEDSEFLFELYELDPKEVTEAVVFEVTLTMKKDGEEDDKSSTVSIIKYKGEWVLFLGDLS